MRDMYSNRHLQDLNLRSRMKQISEGIRVCRLNHSAKVSHDAEFDTMLLNVLECVGRVIYSLDCLHIPEITSIQTW